MEDDNISFVISLNLDGGADTDQVIYLKKAYKN